MMIFLQLFWSFFQIGLFSIGGGYAVLPLIQDQVVEIHGWLSMNEFSDLISIAEMTPGPIGINTATFVGTRIAGLSGAIVSTLGCIAPACIIVSLLAYLYYRFSGLQQVKDVLNALRPAIIALIASAGVSILIHALWGEQGIESGLAGIDPIALILFALGIWALRKFKPNPLYIMLGAGLISAAIKFI